MAEARIERVQTRAYLVPTDAPESDGTFAWESTTIVVVEVHGAGTTGLGYTYGPRAVGSLIDHELQEVLCGRDPLAPRAAWASMHAALRNAGQGGIGALAISALDVALHDLRARLLGVPLAVALGAVRDAVPVYGSGGFTTYSPAQVAEQLGGWVRAGIPRVKMKVGREPAEDPARIAAAREAIGPEAELMVDANGAFSVAEAIAWAECYPEWDVRWLEEPVTQDDPAGLRTVREHAPPGLAIASGEYSWSRYDAARLLGAGAVDVVQADVTRCGGPTELERIDALCGAANRPLSLHCAPAVSAHVGCALERLVHLEYFHDHVRIEAALFDGVLRPVGGALSPDPATPGHGLSLSERAERYAVA
ncbi:MAG TPA: enolase C-terminal domain-like protein [Solirubrobacteraceae bacterium]|nr:enolase C-terminal domain-like protein [Solirubrobacteraceae bacterium]